MASRIVMSKLSPTMEEGRVLRWAKSEGDAVDAGDVVVEVETDKANMEVEAQGSGTLRKILVKKGATVPTGTILGIIAGEGEDISGLLLEKPEDADPARAAERPEPRPETRPSRVFTEATTEPAEPRPPSPAAIATAPSERGEPAGDGGRLKASPLARRMAMDRGIELREVRGTGPGGRIIKRDIEAASSAGLEAAAVAPAAPTPGIEAAEAPFERVELSQIRKAIARNLVQSLGPIPHFFLTSEIDMGRVIDLRTDLNASLADSGTKIGVNDILVKTAAQALREHPNVNVSFAGDHIRRFSRVDVGIAVALPDGLITPVLRDVQAKGLRQISSETRDLIARARDRRLNPEEYQGATFTISNLGMYGIDEFTAVINPPAATILAVGATQQKPVVVEGSIQVRSRMRVTLSCDHRAVDGAMGAEFLTTFRSMLENPLRLAL